MPDSSVILPPTLTPTHPDYTRERYSVTEAAAYLIVARSRIYSDAAEGKLGHRKDGNRRLRFAQSDLDAWRFALRVEVNETRRIARGHRHVGPRVVEPLALPAVRRFR